jgi:DNA polymerase III epsilon subunit-like protein
MVATAPAWPEIAEQYASIVAGRTVVAYNASFDVRLLSQTHQRHGLPPALATACAMLLCRMAWGMG